MSSLVEQLLLEWGLLFLLELSSSLVSGCSSHLCPVGQNFCVEVSTFYFLDPVILEVVREEVKLADF